MTGMTQIEEFSQELAEKFLITLVEAWNDVRPGPRKSSVKISGPGLKLLARDAWNRCEDLKKSLTASEGIDRHKFAAALAYTLATAPNIALEVLVERDREYVCEQVSADCALTVFLSLLRCNRKNIEMTQNVWSALRFLFSRQKNLTLLSLAMLAFFLESLFPKVVVQQPVLAVATQ